jgi:hypothetical protein
VQSDGSNPGNFTFLNSDGKAVLLVTQESFLTFTGQTITNGGLMQVEGGAEIDVGVTFTGTGVVELDNGGVLLAEGSVGSGQQIAFADGSGRLLIANTGGFEGVIGFTSVGGNRIDLTDVQAQSAKFIPGERGNPGVLELYAEPNQTGGGASEHAADQLAEPDAAAP